MRSKEQHRRRPQVEALEALVPLSGAGAAVEGALAAKGAALLVTHQARPLTLIGTVRGGYSVSNNIPDTGATYRLGTVGKLSPLGQTAESGSVHTTGFIATGMATGSLTVSAPRGNLKLQLTGPPQSGFAPLPTTLNYTILSGTRSFNGLTGSGSIAVSLNPSFLSRSFGLITLRFQPGPRAVT